MTAEERLLKRQELTLRRSNIKDNDTLERASVWAILEPEDIDLIADLVVERISLTLNKGR